MSTPLKVEVRATNSKGNIKRYYAMKVSRFFVRIPIGDTELGVTPPIKTPQPEAIKVERHIFDDTSQEEQLLKNTPQKATPKQAPLKYSVHDTNEYTKDVDIIEHLINIGKEMSMVKTVNERTTEGNTSVVPYVDPIQVNWNKDYNRIWYGPDPKIIDMKRKYGFDVQINYTRCRNIEDTLKSGRTLSVNNPKPEGLFVPIDANNTGPTLKVFFNPEQIVNHILDIIIENYETVSDPPQKAYPPNILPMEIIINEHYMPYWNGLNPEIVQYKKKYHYELTPEQENLEAYLSNEKDKLKTSGKKEGPVRIELTNIFVTHLDVIFVYNAKSDIISPKKDIESIEKKVSDNDSNHKKGTFNETIENHIIELILLYAGYLDVFTRNLECTSEYVPPGINENNRIYMRYWHKNSSLKILYLKLYYGYTLSEEQIKLYNIFVNRKIFIKQNIIDFYSQRSKAEPTEKQELHDILIESGLDEAKAEKLEHQIKPGLTEKDLYSILIPYTLHLTLSKRNALYYKIKEIHPSKQEPKGKGPANHSELYYFLIGLEVDPDDALTAESRITKAKNLSYTALQPILKKYTGKDLYMYTYTKILDLLSSRKVKEITDEQEGQIEALQSYTENRRKNEAGPATRGVGKKTQKKSRKTRKPRKTRKNKKKRKSKKTKKNKKN